MHFATSIVVPESVKNPINPYEETKATEEKNT